ncbi:MAG: hypothetical protein ACK5PT_17630 [Cereibacter sp.]
MPSLITILRQVPDPRTGNAQRHALLDLLVIALAASVWVVSRKWWKFEGGVISG